MSSSTIAYHSKVAFATLSKIDKAVLDCLMDSTTYPLATIAAGLDQMSKIAFRFAPNVSR